MNPTAPHLLTQFSAANPRAFRQALVSYVKTVVEDEWPRMEKGSMSPDAIRRFDDIWSRFFELAPDPNKSGELYTNLTEAGRQRCGVAAHDAAGGNAHRRFHCRTR